MLDNFGQSNLAYSFLLITRCYAVSTAPKIVTGIFLYKNNSSKIKLIIIPHVQHETSKWNIPKQENSCFSHQQDWSEYVRRLTPSEQPKIIHRNGPLGASTKRTSHIFKFKDFFSFLLIVIERYLAVKVHLDTKTTMRCKETKAK